MFEDVAITDDEDSFSAEENPRKTRRNTIRYESEEDQPSDQVATEDDAQNQPTALPSSRNDSLVDDNKTENDVLAISLHLENSIQLESEQDFMHNVIVTNASVDITTVETDSSIRNHLDAVTEENNSSLDTCIETHGLASPGRSACVSPASSNGGIYSVSSLI